VILGLLIYQGVTTGELQRLGPDNLHLDKRKIFVLGTRKSNSRYLQLQQQQAAELEMYLSKVRPSILKGIGAPTPARKPDQVDLDKIKDRLFISMGGSADLRSSMLHMFRNIQKTFSEIRNAKQVRSSVITHWLKSNNLRQVQYMAGHKYVSSTERYQQNNLDKLQSKLEKFHPLESGFGGHKL
jgi:integrase/recombinase XerD